MQNNKKITIVIAALAFGSLFAFALYAHLKNPKDVPNRDRAILSNTTSAGSDSLSSSSGIPQSLSHIELIVLAGVVGAAALGGALAYVMRKKPCGMFSPNTGAPTQETPLVVSAGDAQPQSMPLGTSVQAVTGGLSL